MRATLSPQSSCRVYRALLIAGVVACASIGVAQVSPPLDAETTSAESSTEMRFWLRVTGERVNIRSRADVNSRIVGHASAGDLVEATAEEYGWFRIVPPVGVHSLVASEFIDRVGGASGVVNVDTSLRVRVGSDIQERDPELSEVQTRLQPGDEVQILGQLNEQWLKISPPADVRVYIWGEFTERVGDDEAARIRANGPSAKPAEAPKTAPVAAEDAATKPPITEKPAEPTSQPAPVVIATPEPVREITQAPPASQPAPLRAVLPPPQPAPAPEAQIKQVTPQPPKTEAIPRRQFDARGVLQPSFDIEPGEYGLRYTLSDAVTHKRHAYIEIPPELGFKAPESVGNYVGVHGVWVEDPAAGVKVLRATHVAVLKVNRP